MRHLRSSALRKVSPAKVLAWFLIVVVVCIFGVGLFIFASGNSGDEDKLFFVSRSQAEVVVFAIDSKLSEITLVKIPNETEVEVAAGLGTRRIGNVYELGQQEDKENLLALTVSKNFKLPVYLWAEIKTAEVLSPNPLVVVQALFSNYESNLKFGHKLKIAAVATKLSGVKRVEIDMKKTQSIRAITLLDGEEGYKVTGLPSAKVLAIFSDPSFSANDLTVSLIDYSQNPNLVEEVSEIVEVLGPKVVSVVSKEDQNDLECNISGRNKSLVRRVATLFSCSEGSLPVGNFDLEIEMGEGFSKRF